MRLGDVIRLPRDNVVASDLDGEALEGRCAEKAFRLISPEPELNYICTEPDLL